MMFVQLGEGILRSRCFISAGPCGLPVQLWVRAHRMARDMLTSSLIFFIGLAPIVLLNKLNELLCPGCSAHQLLIYRQPGHLARKEAVIVDVLDDMPCVGVTPGEIGISGLEEAPPEAGRTMSCII